jgi:hypothetical protein
MAQFDSLSLHNALTVLGNLLSDRQLHFEVVAIGGSGLLLLGMISRPTKDVDVVALVDEGIFTSAKQLPGLLREAIIEVGTALRLGENWFNTGPADLFLMGLPEGFAGRMSTHHYGGLTLHLASRFDQICFKLYASIDQGPNSKHFADLQLLKPTQEELEIASSWCKTHDVSEGFAANLSEALVVLGGS